VRPDGVPASPPPIFPLDHIPPRKSVAINDGEVWMRTQVGPETKIVISVTGTMRPKQIGKLITLLSAQRAVLEHDDDEESGK